MTFFRSTIFLLLLAMILLSTHGVLIKNIFADSQMTLPTVVALRSVLAVLLWIPFLKCRHEKAIVVYLKLSKKQFGVAICFTITNVTFVYATITTTAHNAVFLQYTNGLWVVLISFLLGRLVTRTDWIALLLTLSGMLLFFFDELAMTEIWGLLAGVLCSLSYAGVILLLSDQKAPADRLVSLTIGNILTALIFLPFCSWTSPSGQSTILILILGVLSLGLSWIILTEVLERISAVEFAILGKIGPVMNPVWVFMFPPHEVPGFFALWGAALILFGVFYKALDLKRRT